MDKINKVNKYANRRSTGFSLIETLIALVIVSVGLLGIAALQTLALRNTQAANIASQATIAAHDIIERMRANPAGIASKHYDMPNLVVHENCYTTVGCTPAELAEHDAYEWASTLATDSIPKKIPQGSAIVCIDSTPNDGTSTINNKCDGISNIYAIKVWSGEVDTPTYQQFITTVTF